VKRLGLEAHAVRVPARARGAAHVKGATSRPVRRPPGPPRDVVLCVPEDEGWKVVRNVEIDHEVRSINAAREHWGQRQARRAKVHRIVKEAFGVPEWKPPVLPAGWKWLAVFTRYGRLKLDRDNATAAFKEHIDTVAEILGIDDSDPAFDFQVVQVQRSVRAMVKRWDRTSRRTVERPGFKSWFRVRLEQVRVEAAPIRWALTERISFEASLGAA
jgi:hypothetical protein